MNRLLNSPGHGLNRGPGAAAPRSAWGGGTARPLKSRATAQPPRGNRRIADLFEVMARTLLDQGANVFRANTYRRAALAVAAEPRNLQASAEPRNLQALAEPRNLQALAEPRDLRASAEPRDWPPLSGFALRQNLTPALAGAVEEIRRTGRWVQLDRLLGRHDPVQSFQALPGVGQALARHLAETLGIDTLEALEAAVGDGRIAAVKGLGPRRIADLRGRVGAALLASRGPERRPAARAPALIDLRDADAEFRAKARSGLLPLLSAGAGPVLHTERGAWHLTLRFAPEACRRAMGAEPAPSIVYFQDERQEEGQRVLCTRQPRA